MPEREESRSDKRSIAEKETAKRKIIIIVLALCVLVLVISGYFTATKLIIPKSHYDRGVSLRASGEWQQAVAEFEAAGKYSDASEQILETEYQHAKQLYADGDYLTAYFTFQNILGYKDVNSTLKDDGNLIAAAREVYKTAGSIVSFGTYEQDNDTANGPEPIQWIVLAAEGEKSLLLSRYGLDVKAYNNEWADITWEKSSLRTWLNNSFMNAAFRADEQTAILSTPVDNSNEQAYSGYSTHDGNNTQDRIFLLSYHEAFDLYFSSDEFRKCAPTDYAIAQGARTSDNQNTVDRAGWWWLRSLGYGGSSASYVNSDGSLGYDYIDTVYSCVRPAFWLDLESDTF